MLLYFLLQWSRFILNKAQFLHNEVSACKISTESKDSTFFYPRLNLTGSKAHQSRIKGRRHRWRPCEGASCVSWINPVDLDPGSSGRIKGALGRQSCTNTNIGLDGGPQVTPGVEGSFLMKVSSALIKSLCLSNSRVCSQLWEWVTAPRLKEALC